MLFKSRDFPFDLREVADISLLDMDHDLIEVSKHFVTASGSSEIPVPVPNAPGLTPIQNAVECSDQSVDMLIYKCDYCLVILAEAENSACLSFRDLLDCSAICKLDERTVSSHCCCSNFQGYEISETFAMQSVHPPGSDLLETSSCQIPHAVSFPDDDSTPLFGTEPECKSLGTTEQDPVKCSPAGLIHASDAASFPCDNCSDRFGSLIQPNDEKSPKSVHLDTYVLRPSDILKKLPSTDEKVFMHAEQIESGDIFNEISCISSLDAPFFSCDLIRTNSTHQQEYSLLDRQLIMSPMGCFSPIGLWDSPSQDASHEI